MRGKGGGAPSAEHAAAARASFRVVTCADGQSVGSCKSHRQKGVRARFTGYAPYVCMPVLVQVYVGLLERCCAPSPRGAGAASCWARSTIGQGRLWRGAAHARGGRPHWPTPSPGALWPEYFPLMPDQGPSPPAQSERRSVLRAKDAYYEAR